MLNLRTPLRSVAISATFSSSLVGTALAKDNDCLGYGSLATRPAVTISRVTDSAPRTYFVHGGSDVKGCPDATEACRDKAFLVPGDQIFTSATHGPFVCADYVNAKGADRAGWLPAAALSMVATPPVTLASWTGVWGREEATVTIKQGRGGALTIHGDATFGATDPDRVKRGAINVGEVDGITTPNGADLAFTMGEHGTLPVDKGEDTDCKVWMRRLGPYLLVDDNSQCGGANVSFGGFYGRKS